mgnify:FL=1
MDLILSDLHANLHAFRTVLRFARRRAVRRFVLLGDLVGYGAHPNQVLDRLRRLHPRVMLRGNHDRACAYEGEGTHFSLPARLACAWTRRHLSRENLRFLQSLPRGPLTLEPGVLAAHGAPWDEAAYLLQDRDASQAFASFEGRLCFFGHTHHPGGWELDPVSHRLRGVRMEPGVWVDLDPARRYLLNPGSVGQPRDRDPRLSFMAYDAQRHRVKLHRLDYDSCGAGRAILAAGLHATLAERLQAGT